MPRRLTGRGKIVRLGVEVRLEVGMSRRRGRRSAEETEELEVVVVSSPRCDHKYASKLVPQIPRQLIVSSARTKTEI